MAITSVKNPSSLKMKFYCGKDENQKNIIRTRTYSNLRPDSTDQDVYDVGVAIGSLQKNNVVDIIKLDNTTISE